MAKEVFNAAAFFICFREAIEACLIVGIMLAYTKRTGNQRYNRCVSGDCGREPPDLDQSPASPDHAPLALTLGPNGE